MLEDREYMRRRPTGDDEGNARSGRTCILALIIINAAVYLLFGGNTSLCLDPVAVRNGDVLRIVTAVFMHEGFFHLLFNMYALYFFGMMIAPTLGARRFLSLFLFSGVAGNILWLAANWNTPALLLGASGAVMGVIMAAALLAPDVEILEPSGLRERIKEELKKDYTFESDSDCEILLPLYEKHGVDISWNKAAIVCFLSLE